MTRVVVDQGLCSGHARCNVTAPDVYELDELGYVVPPPDTLSDEVVDDARRGAASCPERALQVGP